MSVLKLLSSTGTIVRQKCPEVFLADFGVIADSVTASGVTVTLE